MYRASIENRGDSRYHVTTRNGSFVLDTEGGGPNPVDTLVAALCGCIGHYVRDYLRERGVPCDRFTVAGEAANAPDKTRLSRIDVRIDLGRALDEPQRTELLAYVERCKVHNTLKAACPIAIALAPDGEPIAPRSATAPTCC